MSDMFSLLKKDGALSAIGGGIRSAGTLYSSQQDAKALNRQAREAFSQGYADEQASRRSSRAILGKQAAAIAQAGIGPGGTGELVMRDSELNAEMDALNYRYRGIQQGRALRSAASRTKSEGFMLAGAQLLSSVGEYKNQRSILSNGGA